MSIENPQGTQYSPLLCPQCTNYSTGKCSIDLNKYPHNRSSRYQLFYTYFQKFPMVSRKDFFFKWGFWHSATFISLPRMSSLADSCYPKPAVLSRTLSMGLKTLSCSHFAHSSNLQHPIVMVLVLVCVVTKFLVRFRVCTTSVFTGWM